MPSVSQSRTQLDTLSNPLPEAFREQRDSGFKLMGSSGAWTDASGNYVGVYSTSDINADPWVDSADLSEPMWQSVPVNQELALVVGDPTKNSIIQGTNEYNRQIPGQTVEDTVVVERLAPDGSVVSSQTVETSERSGEGLLDPSTMPYATYTFDEGVYRISAEDSSFSYLIMAGSPTAIIDQYVNDINASLTDYSQNVEDALNAGGLSRVTTTTDANGEFAFDVPDGTKVVHVQAYKSSALTDVQNVDPQNVTLGDIRDEYSIDRSASQEQIQEQLDSLPEGSIYLPSRAYRVEPPNQNVTVRMVEVTMPPLGDLEALQSRQQQLLDELNNGSFQDLLGDRLEDINEEELRDVYSRLDRLRERNERIDSRYRELLENSTYEDIEIDVNETGNAELRTRIRNLQESVRRLQDTIDSEPPEIETGSESINARFRFDEALERDDVTVLAHWSNGTTTTVPDEYVDLDGSLGNTAGVGSTSVRLSDFPLGEQDPNSVEFEVLVANEDGTGTSRVPVKNPTFSGDLPTLDSVAVSSLEPGPSDAVEVTLTPSEDSSFRSVTGATVYGPSGSTVATVDAANITDGNTFEFSTNGQGRYWVEAQVESADGAQFTLPFSLNAANSDKPRQPGIRAKSGPLGTYAVVGDGFDAGAVRTTAQGDVEVIGQLNQDQDVPDRVQVYLSALDDSRDSEVTVRLTRGENRESINEHVYVTLHGKSLTDDALVYRNGDQPLTRDASTRFGRVGTGGNGTVIETYTQADGSVSVRTINNPGSIDRLRHYVRTFTADLDVPFITIAPALPSPETTSTTVATISPATMHADTSTWADPGIAHGAVAATEAVI
ncbi:hypothetical protein C2R22_24490 (plasmid) [Salinigranum rubrum]|uniref:Uncharacterized protein n=2 Tax=Salinigranum rubrum TaxID=755307 RepID=A0A2I8VRY6_9EURY|nr:hypothetical protein C2R22_24490 [Salinigranum rubrum]